MHRYSTVVTKESREAVQAYLYDHTTIVAEKNTEDRNHFLLKTNAGNTGLADFLAKYQTERLTSGLHGVSGVYELEADAVDQHKANWGVDLLAADTVRVLVAIDVPVEQAADAADLIASVKARLIDEAGYLNSGDPVSPTKVTLALVEDTTPLTTSDLAGIYFVGVEGVQG